MVGNVQELRPKIGSDTEKITINLGYVDLGHIDLLVEDGFYSTRTDLIRTAIRNQIERHADAAKQSVSAQEPRPWPAALQPRGPRGGPCGGTATHHSGTRLGQHRRGRHTRTGPWRHRLSFRARCAPSQCGREDRLD